MRNKYLMMINWKINKKKNKEKEIQFKKSNIKEDYQARQKEVSNNDI